MEIVLPASNTSNNSMNSNLVEFLVARLLKETLDEYYNFEIVHKKYNVIDFKNLYEQISEKLKDYREKDVAKSTIKE